VTTVKMPVTICLSLLIGAVGAAALEQDPPSTIVVTSSAIKHEQPLPIDYTADGKNISPPLAWTKVPSGTRQLAMIMDDPVAPTPQPFVHWVLYKIPATAKGLPEALPMDETLAAPPDLAGTIQGVSGFRKPGYRGPAPPKPGVVHRYQFTVYALDAELDLKPGLNKAGLLEAMKGHILATGQLIGTYERKPKQ
jgi:Raf kinase inhibitor-like YbhB/YbcL family protein